MIDLYEQLPELEKVKLNNFINRWGVKTNFIGLEKWLSNWSHSKQKLYKLLGNQFVYTQNINYKRDKNELQRDIENIDSRFPVYWKNFVRHLSLYNYREEERITTCFKAGNYFNNKDTEYYLIDFMKPETLAEGVVPNYIFIKERKPGSAREFRMQKGAKIFRAITQTLKYYKEEVEVWQEYFYKEYKEEVDLFKSLDDYRAKYSVVVNNKNCSGELHISINPIDYLAMSDNGSKWSSCMSWTDSGCYHVGTVEMMNSNNVLCCYITKGKNKDYDFFYRDDYYRGHYKEEDYENRNKKEWVCPDKKWRQLVYINKDILIGGKAYPFINNDITILVLKVIHELAKKNLNWTYQYGPELYKDMKYIRSEYALDRARGYMKYNPRKKNILFDTKGMYNDLIGNKMLNFWCYRNKVKKTKVLSISGKAPCLCCGKSVVYYDVNDDWYYDEGLTGEEMYHERYHNCSNVICEQCLDTNFTCYSCGSIDPLTKFTILPDGNQYCESCCEDKIKKCPGCGKFFIKRINDYYIKNKNFSEVTVDDITQQYDVTEKNVNDYSAVGMYCCQKCCEEKKELFDSDQLDLNKYIFYKRNVFISKKGYDFNDPEVKKYFSWNLIPYK